jgi:glyoxylase I family protein
MDFDSPEHLAVRETRANRAAGQLIRGWSHIASRVEDLEATRHFYEDVLGLPLVLAHHADNYPEAPGKPTNYMHAFFELGDGSCIAFFQFAAGNHGDMAPHSPDMYERHLAMRVETMDGIRAIEVRLKAEGLKHQSIDHGPFYSIYVNDPDGDTIEVTYHTAMVDALYCQPDARLQLGKWLENVAWATAVVDKPS